MTEKDDQKDQKKKPKKQEEDSADEEDQSYAFANMANSGNYVINPLRDSIIYDSGCNDPLT